MIVAGFLPVLKSIIFRSKSSLLCPANDSIPGCATPLVPWQLAHEAARLRSLRASAAIDPADKATKVIPAATLNRKVNVVANVLMSCNSK